MTSFNDLKNEVFGREQRRQHFKDHVKGLTAFERHKAFIGDYVKFYGRKLSVPKVPLKTDYDTMRETYRFIRSEEDDGEASWEQRLAKKYYSKLFKEYCLADMSRYKESKVGLRWRTEKEVVAGKGQFVCGAKGCEERVGLHSYEVNFAYVEAGEEKQALVKLRVCSKDGYHLNYRKEKEAEKRKRKEANKERKRRNMNDGEEAEATRRSDGAMEGREGEEGEEGVGKETLGDGTDGVEGEGEQEHAGIDRKDEVEMQGGTLAGDESVWRGKLPQVEPNKEEEFDDYFRGMFL